MPPSLQSLPLELFLNVVGYIWGEIGGQDVHVRHLSPLSRVNRACHDLLTPVIYQIASRDAIVWAVQNNNLIVLKAALRHTNQDVSVLLKYRVNDRVLQAAKTVPRQQLEPNRHIIDDWRLRPARSDDDWWYLRPWHPKAGLLHLACASDAKDVVEFLLDLGVPIDARSQAFCSCLDFEKQLEMGTQENNDEVEPVVERLSDPVDCPRWLPLHHAICSRSSATAIWLLKRGAPLRLASPTTNQPRMTALQCAIAHGLVGVVKYLLVEHDCQESTLDNWVGYLESDPQLNAMHYLALCYDLDSCRSIIKQLEGAGLVLSKMPLDSSPLATACQMGNFVAAHAFLEAGASPFATKEGRTCLELVLGTHYCSWSRLRSKSEEREWEERRYALVQNLILAGVPTDGKENDRITPLMLAAKNGLMREMRALLNLGTIDMNRIDTNHWTALTYATAWGKMEAVKLLLDAGADINTHGSETHLTAAHWVIGGEQWVSDDDRAQAIRFLIDQGANFGILQHSQFSDIQTSALWDLMANYPGDDGDEPFYQTSALGVVLTHATRLNIDEETWQHALLQELSFLTAQTNQVELDFFVARKLFEFGTRLGYLIGDESRGISLSPLFERYIATGSPAFLDGFFALGDGTGIPTHTGVFNREAALVIAVLLGRTDHDILMTLADWDRIVRGRVSLLRNTTLLHLACADRAKPMEMSRHLFALKPDDGSSWNLNAVTDNLQTPLMLAVQNESIESLELAKFLLSRGADPYQHGHGASLGDQYERYHLLQPKNGKRLSRFAIDMIDEGKERLKFDAGCHGLSAFDIAIRLGRLDMVEEFLKHKPPSPDEVVQNASSGLYLWAIMMHKVNAAQESTLLEIASLWNANGDPPGGSILAKILDYATTKSLLARSANFRVASKSICPLDHHLLKPAVIELGIHIAVMGELMTQGIEVDKEFLDLIHAIDDKSRPCRKVIRDALVSAFDLSDRRTVSFGSPTQRQYRANERPADWADPELTVGPLRWVKRCLKEGIFRLDNMS
ncbi:hypothetical protein QBC44DRAFT_355094 [Cladorrhinum sp. PSN332]|nr:hypothetical protein QBC44DRAFT_355094 [Cladorrhinum sp. PSN332]